MDSGRDDNEMLGVARAPVVGEVLVDEYEARRGVTRTVRWRSSEPCDACEGDGAAPGALSMPCPACDGTGRRHADRSLSTAERLLQIDDCPTCRGRGRLVSDPCPACGGAGETVYDDSGEVAVPPRSSDGDRVPLLNRSNGEVVVRVRAAPPEHTVVRYAALLGLIAALVFLWLLLR